MFAKMHLIYLLKYYYRKIVFLVYKAKKEKLTLTHKCSNKFKIVRKISRIKTVKCYEEKQPLVSNNLVQV